MDRTKWVWIGIRLDDSWHETWNCIVSPGRPDILSVYPARKTSSLRRSGVFGLFAMVMTSDKKKYHVAWCYTMGAMCDGKCFSVVSF